MGGVGLGAGCLTEPEGRREERRVGLDVRAHHQDVARLESRVVGHQADQHLAQHLDLAGGAVAGVHLDGVVVGVELAVELVETPVVVGADVRLEESQQARSGVSTGSTDRWLSRSQTRSGRACRDHGTKRRQ